MITMHPPQIRTSGIRASGCCLTVMRQGEDKDDTRAQEGASA